MSSKRPPKKATSRGPRGVPEVKLLLTAAAMTSTLSGWALLATRESAPPESSAAVVEAVATASNPSPPPPTPEGDPLSGLLPLPTLVPGGEGEAPLPSAPPPAVPAAPPPAPALRDVSVPPPAPPVSTTRSSR